MEKIEKEKPEIRELTLQNGITFPSDAELIMLILGSGTKRKSVTELSIEVLHTILGSNPENLIENLCAIDGIGSNKALQIAASMELGRRISKNPEGTLTRPRDIIPYIQNYAIQPSEHFLCISLNGARDILSIRVVSIGSSNMAIIKPADVFNEALKLHASAVIISHNHPSGNPQPSKDDLVTTKRLNDAAQILGISLLDHIIISKDSFFSFLEHDLLDEDALDYIIKGIPKNTF